MSKGRGGGGIRVVVAATASARRLELEAVIRTQPDFQLTASIGAIARVAHYARDSEIDVVVVESDRLPQNAEPATAAIVLLTQHTDARTTARLLKAGVRSILPRDSDGEEIVSAIYAVYGGHVLLSAEAAEQLAAVYGDEPQTADEPTEEVTPREGEVLRMMAEGLGNKEIAARLAISEHTVKFHISSILAKLGAGTRTEAVTIGIRRGLIPI